MERPTKTDTEEDRRDEGAENVMGAHGDAPRRDGRPAHAGHDADGYASP